MVTFLGMNGHTFDATDVEVVTEIIRKRTLGVCELLQQVTADNIASRKVDYIEGTARLGADHTVIVTDSILSGAACGETVMPKSTSSTPLTVRSSSLPAS